MSYSNWSSRISCRITFTNMRECRPAMKCSSRRAGSYLPPNRCLMATWSVHPGSEIWYFRTFKFHNKLNSDQCDQTPRVDFLRWKLVERTTSLKDVLLRR